MAITAPPEIDALPSPPDPNDRSTYNARAYPWSIAQQTFATQVSAVSSNVYSNALEAQAKANEAASQVVLAAEQVALAENQVYLAASQASTATTQAGVAAAGASTATTQSGIATAAASWASDQADIATTQAGIAATKAAEAAASAASIADGPVTSVNSKTGVVTLVPADIGLATAGQVEMEAGTETALRAMSPLRVAQAVAALGKMRLPRSARTSNTALGPNDLGALIDCTGTFTQTVADLATLGSTWYCYIRNSGTGDITIDPFGSQTIDGRASYIMYPQEMRLIVCDGSALVSYVLNPFAKVFTASATFVKPPGYSYFGGIGWGGGASGARSNSASSASRGGGGGMCFPFQIAASKLGASETITIAAGGSAYTGTSGTTHNAGGDTSIGSLLTINGATNNSGAGYGTTASSPVGFEGLNNPANSAALAVYGGGACPTTPTFDSTGSRFGGGAGGGCSTGGVEYLGGASLHGGNGGNASSASSGADGAAPGGGGGATQTGAQGGAGGRGEVRIWGVI